MSVKYTSGPGHPVFMSLHKGLKNIAAKVLAEEHQKEREKLKAKIDRSENNGKYRALTDAQILELRALSEFAGWTNKQLQDRYGLDAVSINRYVGGITRSRLVATRKHLPKEIL